VTLAACKIQTQADRANDNVLTYLSENAKEIIGLVRIHYEALEKLAAHEAGDMNIDVHQKSSWTQTPQQITPKPAPKARDEVDETTMVEIPRHETIIDDQIAAIGRMNEQIRGYNQMFKNMKGSAQSLLQKHSSSLSNLQSCYEGFLSEVFSALAQQRENVEKSVQSSITLLEVLRERLKELLQKWETQPQAQLSNENHIPVLQGITDQIAMVQTVLDETIQAMTAAIIEFLSQLTRATQPVVGEPMLLDEIALLDDAAKLKVLQSAFRTCMISKHLSNNRDPHNIILQKWLQQAQQELDSRTFGKFTDRKFLPDWCPGEGCRDRNACNFTEFVKESRRKF
jgi:uncharacterized protein YukE